jgi:hypothetical protein
VSAIATGFQPPGAKVVTFSRIKTYRLYAALAKSGAMEYTIDEGTPSNALIAAAVDDIERHIQRR